MNRFKLFINKSVFNEKGKPETIRYHLFTPLLVSAYQELFTLHQEQQSEIKKLQDDIKKLEGRETAYIN